NNVVLGVLGFITAGRVDDGKSKLIGRLLFDSMAVLSDQLCALSRARKAGRARVGGAQAGCEGSPDDAAEEGVRVEFAVVAVGF
ncbi:hypothetical protein AAHH78_36340, partial [Burkholderia pseudomallei]